MQGKGEAMAVGEATALQSGDLAKSKCLWYVKKIKKKTTNQPYACLYAAARAATAQVLIGAGGGWNDGCGSSNSSDCSG